MRARTVRWACAALVLFVTTVSAGLAAPARACGCGAYIPDSGAAAVTTERALVAFDGARQDVVMSFQVAGGSATAAWIMPVPSRAEVTLADPDLFTELDDLTAPRVEYRDDWWPSFGWLAPAASSGSDGVGAAAPGGVDVLDRQRIGPFDVATLAAGEASDLATWLSDNGFPTPDDLQDNLAVYVDRGWQVVAVKLVPGESGALTGDLEPLRLSFASQLVVYPMRLSRSATTPQTVDLYVLAGHRMDPDSAPITDSLPTIEYAGRIDADTAPPALAPFLQYGDFLTRWSDVITQPENIDGDYVFVRADEDTPFQRVVYVTRDRGELTGAILLGVVVLSIAAAIIVTVRMRRRSP